MSPLFLAAGCAAVLNLAISAALFIKLRQGWRGTNKAFARIERRLQELEPALLNGTQKIVGVTEKRLLAKAEREQRRTVQELRDDSVQQGYLAALNNLYQDGPVFMGGPAIDGYTARALFDMLDRNRPSVIVELGSGSSTLLIASLKRYLKLDAFHVAVDEQALYLESTKRLLEREAPEAQVEFVLAEIQSYENPNSGECKWYGNLHARLASALAGRKIDLLIVDGPSGHLCPQSRKPALPELRELLSDRAKVLLDDACRDDEIAISDAWERDFPEFSVERSRRGKGYTLLSLK